MAELEILIDGQGAVRGSDVVIRSLKGIRAETDKAEGGAKKYNQRLKEGAGAAKLFKRALAGIGLGILARQFIVFSDAFTGISNKVKIATAETGGLAATTEELFQIAQRTRAPIESITTLYQRASLAAKELGVSQQTLLKFTESIGQALAIQGGSVASSSGALLQLSQALGSGIVRAEEFNAILEGAFPIAKAAAEGLDAAGGSVARLRTLIVEGKVSSEEFFGAIQKSAPDLEKLFANTNITIGQSFTLLRNQLIESLGAFNESSGAAVAFANAIKFVALNLESLVKAGIAAAAVFGPRLLVKSFKAARQAVILFNIAVLANPLGIIISLIAGAIAALVLFADKISIPGLEFVKLGDLAQATWNFIVRSTKGVTEFFVNAWEIATGFVTSAFANFPITLTDVFAGIKTFVNRAIGTFLGLAKVILFGWGKIRDAVVSLFDTEFFGFIFSVGKNIIGFFGKVFKQIKDFAVGALEFVGVASKKVGDKLGEQFDLDVPGVLSGIRGFGDEASDIFLEAFNRDYLAEIGAFILPAIDEISKEAGDIARANLAALEAGGEGISDKVPDRPFALQADDLTTLEKALTSTQTPLETMRMELAEITRLRGEVAKLPGDTTAFVEALNRMETLSMTEFAEAVNGVDLDPVVTAMNDLVLAQETLGMLNEGDAGFAAAVIGVQNFEKALFDARLEAVGLSEEDLFSKDDLRQQFNDAKDTLNALFEEGIIDKDSLKAGMKALKEQFGQTVFDMAELAKQAARNIQDAFADFLFDPFQEDGLNGMLRGFADTLRRMAAEALSQQIIQGLLSAFGGGFGGSFAEGGDFERGRPMLVGEKGPEIITPRQPGTVVPNNMLGGGQQAAPVVNVSPTPVVVLDDPKKVIAAMQSPEGQRTMVDNISTKRGAVNQALS